MLARNCLLLFLWYHLQEGSASPAPPIGSPSLNGPAGFQRVKRGWVWNQFFVLEEYMGSDPQYVGKVKNFYSTTTLVTTSNNP
uniref:Cadherin N-terminal domain-containing protein n=1 Tax=Hippocampus comes TaxID=109280 RepID=A0A3Q2XQT9_HIPCM